MITAAAVLLSVLNIAIADATQTDHVHVYGVSEIGDFTELDGAAGVAIHDISDRTYAVVTASVDDGVQIMDITQPYNPLPVAAISDNINGFT